MHYLQSWPPGGTTVSNSDLAREEGDITWNHLRSLGIVWQCPARVGTESSRSESEK